MELDFVLPGTDHTLGIEVKSGRKKRSSSLLKMQNIYGSSEGIKLTDGNILVDENGTLHLPLFAMHFFEPSKPDVHLPDYLDAVKDEDENRRSRDRPEVRI